MPSDRKLNTTWLYVFFLFQGIGLLFPWNSLITSDSYYKERLTTLPGSSTIFGWFCIIFMSVKLFFLTFSSLIVHVVSPEMQVIFSSVGNCIVFLGLCLMPSINDAAISHTAFLAWTLVLVFFASLFSAFSNNGLYTILGRYPPRFTQALSNGQGLAGILACVIKIICIAVTKDSASADLEMTLTYAASAVIIGGCSALFILYHEKPEDISLTITSKVSAEDDEMTSLKGGRLLDDKKEVTVVKTYTKLEYVVVLLKEYASVFSEIYLYALAAFLCLCVTLSVFPGFMFNTPSTMALSDDSMYKKTWSFIHMLLFNGGDWIGKSLPMIPALAINNGLFIFGLAALRVIHYPLYLFGNVHLSKTVYPLATPLKSDTLFYFISIILGIVNGYVATLSMMFGPSAVKDPKSRSKAGTVMIYSLTLGLTCGVLLATLMWYLLYKTGTPF